jgi:hypothetical protein
MYLTHSLIFYQSAPNAFFVAQSFPIGSVTMLSTKSPDTDGQRCLNGLTIVMHLFLIKREIGAEIKIFVLE